MTKFFFPDLGDTMFDGPTTLEPILAEHPFLKGMKKEHLTLITGCASNVKWDAGTYLFKEGQDADQFYIVRQGTIAIEAFSPAHGPLVLQTVGEGDIMGWAWLVPPYRWHFDGHATDLVRAIAFDGKCLRTKCEKDHELGYELLKRFSEIGAQRLDMTRMQLLDLYEDMPTKGIRRR
jgi:CRP-like cAMP-binding protein